MSLSHSLSALLHSLIRLLAFSLGCLYDQWNNSVVTDSSVLYLLLPLFISSLLLFSTLTSPTSPIILSSSFPCLWLFSVLSLSGVWRAGTCAAIGIFHKYELFMKHLTLAWGSALLRRTSHWCFIQESNTNNIYRAKANWRMQASSGA